MPLDRELSLHPTNIVLDADRAPLSRKGGRARTQFSANVRCGETAGWTEMRLGMEVGLGSGDFVLERDPAPPKK